LRVRQPRRFGDCWAADRSVFMSDSFIGVINRQTMTPMI
jgi:hypothetical protein